MVRMPPPTVIVGVLLLLMSPRTAAGEEYKGWMDRPVAGWNTQGGEVPQAPASTEARVDLLRRCGLALRESTPAEQALAKAGWVPFLHFDRRIVRDDIEIIGGMSAASPSCEQASFNVFVFVGGRYAGTLSPVEMTARHDGAIGAVRIASPESATAEFARYTSTDTECCPSSHVKVTFRIDRAGPQPLVVPVEARQVRG